jgi:hypothetical protein
MMGLQIEIIYYSLTHGLMTDAGMHVLFNRALRMLAALVCG